MPGGISARLRRSRPRAAAAACPSGPHGTGVRNCRGGLAASSLRRRRGAALSHRVRRVLRADTRDDVCDRRRQPIQERLRIQPDPHRQHDQRRERRNSRTLKSGSPSFFGFSTLPNIVRW